MKNIMLDLKTMGKGPRTAIVTIGAVLIGPMTHDLGTEFEAHIMLRDIHFSFSMAMKSTVFCAFF